MSFSNMDRFVPYVKAEPSVNIQSPRDSNIQSEPSNTSYPFASYGMQAPSQNTSYNDAGNAGNAGNGVVSSGSETKATQSEDDLSNIVPKKTNYLEQLCNRGTLDSLEAGVSVSTRVLSQLRDVLGTYKTRDTDNWIRTIVDMEKRTVPTRTVVGVVGNTGAGKSSVINALLDEERFVFLLPFTSRSTRLSK